VFPPTSSPQRAKAARRGPRSAARLFFGTAEAVPKSGCGALSFDSFFRCGECAGTEAPCFDSPTPYRSGGNGFSASLQIRVLTLSLVDDL
jgi:hypothetical protein